VTFVDITERKAIQEALRRAHEEAELFIDSVPSILIGIRRDGRIKRWNLAAATGVWSQRSRGDRQAPGDCGIQWARSDMKARLLPGVLAPRAGAH
jgi:PAS domain-containing protein